MSRYVCKGEANHPGTGIFDMQMDEIMQLCSRGLFKNPVVTDASKMVKEEFKNREITVIDFCTGIGGNLKVASETLGLENVRYLGFDNYPKAIGRARNASEVFPYAEYFIGDALRPPFSKRKPAEFSICTYLPHSPEGFSDAVIRNMSEFTSGYLALIESKMTKDAQIIADIALGAEEYRNNKIEAMKSFGLGNVSMNVLYSHGRGEAWIVVCEGIWKKAA